LTSLNESRAQILQVSHVILHDLYDRLSMELRNDLAFLVLKEDIKWSTYARNICLPTADDYLYGDINAKASGWGKTWGNQHEIYRKQKEGETNDAKTDTETHVETDGNMKQVGDEA
jgi:hypothetical protein